MSLDYDENRAKSGPALKQKKKRSGKENGQRKKSKDNGDEQKKRTKRNVRETQSRKRNVNKKQSGDRNTEIKQSINRNIHKKQNRKKNPGVISTVVLIVAICVFAFSLFQLIRQLVPYYSGGQEYDEVKNLAITTEKTEDEEERFLVDFDALIAENPDTVAWLRFDEPAVISYPVVKSADNVEYLTRTFSANDNKLGAIFMDMDNNPDFTDRNTFIYGHNMKVGGEMFSQLNEYAAEEFCKQHPYFYIYTPDGKVRTYQVFSAAVIKDTADNYEMTFATEADYVDYLQMCKATSNYQVNVELDASSKIVSLSTCTNVNDDERFLVQGVLIREEMNE